VRAYLRRISTQQICIAVNRFRPGEIAPMSLLTYRDARPWAKAMKEAVLTKKMPPWFAEQGHFANDPTLSQDQVNTLVSWANNGAPEGDEKDKPAPVAFQDGWNIQPDMIVEMPREFHVPATGTINYQNFRQSEFPGGYVGGRSGNAAR
jgi:hypothetical protein